MVEMGAKRVRDVCETCAKLLRDLCETRVRLVQDLPREERLARTQSGMGRWKRRSASDHSHSLTSC